MISVIYIWISILIIYISHPIGQCLSAQWGLAQNISYIVIQQLTNKLLAWSLEKDVLPHKGENVCTICLCQTTNVEMADTSVEGRWRDHSKLSLDVTIENSEKSYSLGGEGIISQPVCLSCYSEGSRSSTTRSRAHTVSTLGAKMATMTNESS